MSQQMDKTEDQIGTLYAIGVGPGDPELLTIKAQKVLACSRFVFTATSGSNKESLALKIAMPHLNQQAQIIPLHFPMTRNKEELTKAWLQNAQRVLSIVEKGHDAAFLTLGDPCTYSTFTYLHRYLLKISKTVKVEIIPGITSFQAAAARVKIPLAEAEESLAVVSGAKGTKELLRALECFDNVVILKAYRKFTEITELIAQKGLLKTTVGIRHVGLKEESISWDIKEWNGEKPSYFTLLIAKKEKKNKKLENQ